ncbi:MAG: sigma-70 family RNA polymerase sigma factor [Candidatus Latescibacteria bacterium]|nr:sigma-70 family RNA polymerase sigma factor [Candidatus Latescibacterota bacterium]
MSERTNAEWLDDLRAEDARQMRALEDLRALLASRLPVILKSKLEEDSPAFHDVLEATITYTLIYAQENLSEFDGQSAFSTWVLKIAVRMALLEIRQRKFQSAHLVRNLPETPRWLHVILAFNPLLRKIHAIFREELTEPQRVAIRAMVMHRMPKEEVARCLGMERDDYFKMIHDARLRLKRRLRLDGWFSKTVQREG